ncbi:flagellar motor protein [Sulfitobacter sp. M57]|uniref:flagellar motor protein n=1 Tax=unclassified Sulfitobacter TaxID=196795 RepID=UPI0023E31A54|nr:MULTISPECIES: flagellar motor protein [unclassified Sulfitobacter]MDF3414847.1 flagellar motor protein [Sulfitobacter sp. KE5]MDF3422328.1 flagellar motor protein [Sulfitobacter sp. KE43]MDF3433393.1 flagellar motor protein [Sulfitobacter sp. KE42]MDF3459033.1 flagellar motor protein [Sulfitobacter sp. S74]MDF3462932.1 flagellar motor protein [Sulfitobacter sp. Ks18]
MALKNRLAALQLIDRIKQHEMETIGAELAKLRAEEKALEDQSAELHADALREAANSTEDTRAFLPAYLNSVEVIQQGLAEDRAATAAQAAQSEEQLFAAFRETKTTEQILKRVNNDITEETARKAASQMDDADRALYMLTRTGQIPG